MSNVTQLEPSKGKPIPVTSGNLHGVVDACEKVLSDNGYYCMGGSIVAVHSDSVTGATSTIPVSQNMLSYELSQSAKFEKLKADGDSVTIDPPARHIGILNDRLKYKYLKPLAAVAHQPYLRPDGTICSAKGYDKSTGIYCAFNAKDYKISNSPSIEDAKHSLNNLRNFLYEFEYKEPCDESASLAALLTASTRVSFESAPFILITANKPGSGKSFKQRIISKISSAGDPSVLEFSANREEFQKSVLAEFMKSPSAIEFDNLTTDVLAHPSLCTALTSPTIAGRVLGESKTVSVSTRTILSASGNNTLPVDDMNRRTLLCRLEPDCDDPQSRRFKADPMALLAENRADYVSDCLTIIRAFIVARKPMTDVSPIAGFTNWATHCRQPLLWLGLPDPCTTMIQSSRDNPRQKIVKSIIDSLHEIFQSRPFTVRKVIDNCSDELRDLLTEVASDDGLTINNRKLGWWLRNKTGHTGNNTKLIAADSGRVASWFIESTITDAEAYERQSKGY